MSLAQIFERQIEPRLIRENGCWIFQGAAKGGYGVVRSRGYSNSMLVTHRVAFEVFIRRLNPGEVLTHKCGNLLCANPAHLQVVTRGALMSRSQPVSGTGLRWVHGKTVAGHQYWSAKSNSGEKLYHGKSFWDACCARKSWEAKQPTTQL